MEIVGHSDINPTMNVYSHVVPELMRDAVEMLDAPVRQQITVRSALWPSVWVSGPRG